jgi:hypothetical protein
LKQGVKKAVFHNTGGELLLSGSALVELLQAVFSKRVPFRFRANGFSMSPFIRDGDVITVLPFTSQISHLGNVVAFLHPETRKLVVHRVVGKRGSCYFVRGDNSSEEEGPIPDSDILGYVGRVERDGKKVLLGIGPERLLIAFLTRTGFLFRLIFPVLRFIRPIIRRSICE